MSADKRSTHTDALATLGTIITEGGRDAIHLAVEPVIAGEKIWPGQDIGVKDGKAYNQASVHGVKYVGIADPFLKEAIMPDQKFWLIVYPRTITSLRHVWEHPDFSSENKQEKQIEESIVERSEKWLQDYCTTTPWSYKTIMDHADYWSKKPKDSWGDYLTGGAEAEGESLSDEFWAHYEIVRGVTVVEHNKTNFFSCSC